MVPSSNRVAQTKRESSETSRHALEPQHEEISVEAVGSKATRVGVWLECELVKRVETERNLCNNPRIWPTCLYTTLRLYLRVSHVWLYGGFYIKGIIASTLRVEDISNVKEEYNNNNNSTRKN